MVIPRETKTVLIKMASFRVLYTLLRIYDNMFYIKKIIMFYIKYLST